MSLRLDAIQTFGLMIYRNKLRMIYKAHALICLQKCDIINSPINKNLTRKFLKDMSLKEKAKQLKTDIPAVYLALNDKKTPWYAKLFAALTVVYALSPIDFIPDFIPILGYLDDLIILPSLVALTVKFIPKDVFDEYRKQAQDIWKDGKPKKWYYAVLIIFVWVLIIVLIVKAIV